MKLLALIMSLVVGIILAGALLIPVIEDAQNSTADYVTNDIDTSMKFKLDGLDDYIFESNPDYTKFKTNGNNYDLTGKNGTLITTDQCVVTKSGHYMALRDVNGTISSDINTQNKNVVATYEASTKTFTYTVYTDLTNTTVDLEKTYTVENILYLIQNGDYGAIETGGDPDVSYFVNNLSQVIAGGAYTTGALDTSYFAEGATVYVGNSSYTASGTATTTASTTYIDLIEGSSYTITVTDGEDSETFTPYTVYVPQKVMVHTQAQQGLIDLYGVIPIFVIIGILLAAVGAIFIKRND